MRVARLGWPLVAMVLGSLPAHAREEPLWEAGVGIAAVDFPEYRGSDRSRAYALPVPFGVYRGDILRADRHGLRGVFVSTDRVDVSVSVGASLPVYSADNPARAGMPDLKPSLELGPSLQLTAWRSADRQMKLDLRFPLRGAVTVESSPRFIGTQFFPHLNVDMRNPAGMSGWNLGLAAGPVYTDRRYNRYFYDVPGAFATVSRPAYAAGAGYAGTQFLAALSKRFPKFWVGGFARYDTLRGAAFEESPLVRSKRYVAAGIGVSWIFAESSRRVTMSEAGDERR